MNMAYHRNFGRVLTIIKDWRRPLSHRAATIMEGAMSTTAETEEKDESKLRVPAMQRLLDNHFLLLFLGVVLPTVLYLVWAIMEVASVPLAK